MRKPLTSEQRQQACVRTLEWKKANPDRVKARNKARYAANKAQIIAAVTLWRKANPDRRWAQRLKKYGLTPADWRFRFMLQGGRCLVCGTDQPHRGKWCVDHCHATGEVRGIVCSPCNLVVGQLGDTASEIEAAALRVVLYIQGRL
jgi:hypothetical protein